MKEIAQVITTDSDNVTLRFTEHEGCKECSSSFCTVKDKRFTARNPKHLDLSSGMLVSVFLEPRRTIAYSFLVLVLPLLLFVLFYIVSGKLFSASSEIARIAAGICGLALGFLISYIVMKKRRETSSPVIDEVVDGIGN